MDRLIKLVTGVVLIAVLALFMRWAMVELVVPAIGQSVAWVLFGLLVIVLVVGALGYGPLKDKV